jgi:DNA helicase-2/ATP-dependent DNA helicase PcrA
MARTGITVDGRIDLIKKLDTDESSIMDFKFTERAHAEDLTRDQLHVYALGYQRVHRLVRRPHEI